MKIAYTSMNNSQKENYTIIDNIKKVEVFEDKYGRPRLIGFCLEEDEWGYLKIKNMDCLAK